MFTLRGTQPSAAPRAEAFASPLRAITALALRPCESTIQKDKDTRSALHRQLDRMAKFMWRGTIMRQTQLCLIALLTAVNPLARLSLSRRKLWRSITRCRPNRFAERWFILQSTSIGRADRIAEWSTLRGWICLRMARR